MPVVLVTNHHNSYGDADYLSEEFKSRGILFFAGLEMTCEWGDFLLFGEDLSEFQGYTGRFPREKLPRDDIAIVWAHPYRFYPEDVVESIKWDVAGYIDAVEVMNGNCMRSNPYANVLALKMAKKIKKPAVAGSDAHSREMFFMTYTRFKNDIGSYSDFITAIKRGDVNI